jgi:hypothetical protein
MFFSIFKKKSPEVKKQVFPTEVGGIEVISATPDVIFATRKPDHTDKNFKDWTFWIVRNNKNYPIAYYYRHYDDRIKESYWIRLHRRKKHENHK